MLISQAKQASLPAAAATQLCISDPRRRSLILTNANTTADMFAWIDNSLTVNRGIYLPPKSLPIVIDYDTYGDLATYRWFGFSNAIGTVFMTVIEIIEVQDYSKDLTDVSNQSDQGSNRGSFKCYTTDKRQSGRIAFTPIDCSKLLNRLRQNRHSK